MKTVKCFFQVYRPKENPRIKGIGDCTKCQPNPEENKKCLGYQPTTTEPITFFVCRESSQSKKELLSLKK